MRAFPIVLIGALAISAPQVSRAEQPACKGGFEKGQEVTAIGDRSLSPSAPDETAEALRLTTCDAGNHNPDILALVRRNERPVAAVICLMVLVALSVRCFADAEMSAAQRVCCAQMQQDCGTPMAQHHECCGTEAGRSDPLISATGRVILEGPVLTHVTILPQPPVDTFADGFAASPRASDSSPSRSASTSTYLILSVFRI